MVLSAPSGAGKATLLRKLRERDAAIATTVSATTRAPRTGEVDGQDYHFLSEDKFQQLLNEDAFVEWAEVHGRRYGTLKTELDRCLLSGHHVILELDVEGNRSITKLRDDVVSVFLMPPSLEELEKRLRLRATDADESIALRLKNAAAEMAARFEYDYIVVNDNAEDATEDLHAILRAEQCRAARQKTKE